MTERWPKCLKIDFMLSIVKNKTHQDYPQFIAHPINRELWKPAMHVSDDGKIIFDEDVNRTHGTLSRQMMLFRAEKKQYVSAQILEKIHNEISALL